LQAATGQLPDCLGDFRLNVVRYRASFKDSRWHGEWNEVAILWQAVQ
jgi:hypothetical protein